MSSVLDAYKVSIRKVIVTDIILIVVGLLSLALRMFVRVKMLRQFRREDWAMLVAVALWLATAGLSIHTYEMTLELLDGRVELFNAAVVVLPKVVSALSALTMIALKVSVGLFFLHIVGHQKIQRYIILAALALTTICGMLQFGFAGFTCARVRGANRSTAVAGIGQCDIQPAATAVFILYCAVNIAGDVIMTVIGLVALWTAQLPIVAKTIASSVLALGLVGAVATIVRLAIVLAPFDNAMNEPERFVQASLWLLVELTVILLAANLAMIRPLLQLFLESVHLISKKGTSNHTHPTYGNNVTATNKSGIRTMRSVRDPGEEVLLGDIQKDMTVMVVSESQDAGARTGDRRDPAEVV